MNRTLLLLLLIAVIGSRAFSPVSVAPRLRRSLVVRSASGDNLPAWVQSNRNNEEWGETPVPSSSTGQGPNLFDQLSDAGMYGSSKSAGSITGQTLRDISICYLFSLSFLGDFVTQLGCEPPLDVDCPIGEIMTSEQVASLLEAVNSLDPVESSVEYDTCSARELAGELGILQDKFIRLCKEEDVNLPYGLETVLHESVIEHLTTMSAELTSDSFGVDGSDIIDVM